MQRNTTVSEVHRKRSEQVVQRWYLKGWGTVEDFELLKNYANCTVEVPRSLAASRRHLESGNGETKKTALRFFFHEHTQTRRLQGSNESVEEPWLALCVTRDVKGDKNLQGLEIVVQELRGEIPIIEHTKMIIFPQENADISFGGTVGATSETFVVVEQIFKIVKSQLGGNGGSASTALNLNLQRIKSEWKGGNVCLRIVVTPTYVRNKNVSEVRGRKRSKPMTPDGADTEDSDERSGSPTPVPTHSQEVMDSSEEQ